MSIRLVSETYQEKSHTIGLLSIQKDKYEIYLIIFVNLHRQKNKDGWGLATFANIIEASWPSRLPIDELEFDLFHEQIQDKKWDWNIKTE